MTNGIHEKQKLDQPLPPEPGAAPNPTEEEIKKLAEEAAATHTAYQEELEEEEKEAKEEFDKIIESEDQFLALFEKNEEDYNIEIVFNRNLIKLEIIPLTNQDTSYMDMDSTIYNQVNEEEQKVLEKFFGGEQLTDEEQEIYNLVDQKYKEMNSKQAGKVNEMFINLLANHLNWPNHEDNTLDERIAWWARRNFNFRTMLASKVANVIGVTNKDIIYFR